MARPDDERIVTDLPTLSGALRQAIGTRAELPIRFLYELKRNPDASINHVTKTLGIRHRTASRWLAWYRENGLRPYISRPWRESTVQIPGRNRSGLGLSDGPEEHRSEFYARVIEALPRVSMASTPAEWGKEMKPWFLEVFPEVDRVGITLFSTINLLNPGTSPTNVIHQESINTGAATKEDAVVHSTHHSGESIWVASYRSALAQHAFNENEYHPPVGQDYFYRRDEGIGMIGSVVMVKSSSKPPISDELRSDFERLAPLIVRLMSEAVARMQIENPLIRDFRSALTRLDQRGELRGQARKVALLHLGGYSNEQISEEMHIGVPTVRSHTAAMLKALDFATVKEMMAWVISPRSMFTPRKKEE